MKKINVAELLKDCPKGMELYSPIFGEVYLDKIRPHLAIVVTTDKEQGDFKEEFLYDGRYGINGECMLFPSKGKTTWEGFHRPFEDGDILVYKHKSNNVKYTFIYKRRIDAHYLLQYCGWFSEKPYLSEQFDTKERMLLYENYDIRFATEEEKQKLFQAIKDNGYKWNPETKTLMDLIEPLIKPKFKVGDVIIDIYKKHLHCDSGSGKISQITDDKYIFTDGSYLHVQNQDNWELVSNKFDITTLKPFDKVLVRGNVGQKWTHDFFGFMDKDKGYPFVCVGHYVSQCIPFEGNEHLLGTTDDCDKYFKTWN